MLETKASVEKTIQIDRDTNVCEMPTSEVAPGIGLSIVGEIDAKGEFEREFHLSVSPK